MTRCKTCHVNGGHHTDDCKVRLLGHARLVTDGGRICRNDARATVEVGGIAGGIRGAVALGLQASDLHEYSICAGDRESPVACSATDLGGVA